MQPGLTSPSRSSCSTRAAQAGPIGLPTTTSYRIEDYVDDLEELRRHLELETIDLLGWSHGGVVAMSYAAAHPSRVAHLVLVATLARFQAEQEEAMREAMEQRAHEPWYEDAVAALEEEQAGTFGSDEELGELAFREFPLYFASYGVRERAHLERIREPANGDTLRFFNQEIFPTFDLRPQLARIDAPTLILVGERDFICGPSARTTSQAGSRARRPSSSPAPATSSSSRRPPACATR